MNALIRASLARKDGGEKGIGFDDRINRALVMILIYEPIAKDS